MERTGLRMPIIEFFRSRKGESRVRGGHRLLVGLFLLVGIGAAAAGPVQAAEPLRVVIKGVEGEALKNLEATLAPPPGLVRDGRVDREWVERFARQVPKLAAEALKPFGYYHARVEAHLEEGETIIEEVESYLEGAETPSEKVAEGTYRLRVEIHAGEAVRVERVAVAVVGPGAAEKGLRQQIRDFPLQPGHVLRQDLYEQAKGKLKARALDLGYLDAEFAVHHIGIDLERKQAEVELTLATGEQYRFAEPLIHGAPDFPDRFLRRYLAFAEGDVFSYTRLGQTQLNYLNSDRFRDVVVTPRPELAKEQKVPVGIQLVPSARRRLRPGIGYGTDTGARGTLRYKDVNIFHRGHEFSAEFNLAERQQSLTAEYVMPSYRKLTDHTALRTGYERQDIDTFESRSLFVEGELVRAFGSGRLGSAFLRLQQEDFTIGAEDSRSRLVLPGLRFSQRRYDDPLRPRRGYLYRLEVRGAHQALGSDTGLLQALGSANTLQPLPWGFAAFARVQAGATWQNEPLREIPPSLRFFAGGDQSVRGYGYQTLGPRDSNDEVVGGKNLLVGSVELERALSENWGVAVFYDAGNAFDSFSDYEIFQGAGLGVRRYTPVGPVKVDLARQLGVLDPSYRVHVSIGFAW